MKLAKSLATQLTVRRARMPAGAAASSASSASFAAAVAARHGASASPWPASTRVLRHDATVCIVRQVRQLFNVVLAPRLRIALGGHAGVPEAAAGWPALGGAGAASAMILRTLRHELFAERLLQRQSRHSSLEATTTRVLRAVEQVNYPASRIEAAPPVASRAPARVLARPAAVRSMAPPQLPPVAAARAPAAAPLSPWHASAPAAAPAPRPLVDLQLLTRDVMRGIDERIVAHRERMGRD